MSISVYLSINKGSGKGTIYDFSSPTSIYVGRHNDCGIIVLEPTVSRYHCLIDIVPPSVKVRDFGSLNGTFVNQVLIGKREKNQSIEEAQKRKASL